MNKKRILVIILFAIAMAYIESAIVVYLRDLYGIVNLLEDTPTKPDKLTFIEIGRELATLVMLFSIGLITGKKLQDRIGNFLIAFGIWDIFYYLWLFVFIGWPTTIMEWDILFLIPLPWWGPVLAPVLIAISMTFWGCIMVLKSEKEIFIRFNKISLTGIVVGIFLMLYTFLEYSFDTFLLNKESYKPSRDMNFNWIMFIISFLITNGILYKRYILTRK